jgi:rSAM/selenodomain-associated transferase 1
MPGKEWGIPKQRLNKKQVLLVFARAPEVGRVKTRLAKDVGPANALDLYKRFVLKVLAVAGSWAKDQTGASGSVRREIWVCYTPKDRKICIKNWLGREYVFLAQSGLDLGDRMARAMAAAFFRGATQVVLVGTDIPDMGCAHLEAAFKALEQTDLVWGPSLDGGYWLVGARTPDRLAEVFKDVPWGTDQVLSMTYRRCDAAGLSRTSISPLQDVDTFQDLKSTRFYRTEKG